MSTQPSPIQDPFKQKVQLPTDRNVPFAGFQVDLPSTPDPAPFDADGAFSEWNKLQLKDRMADNREAFHGVMAKIAQPFVTQGYNALASLNRGTAHFYTHLDLAAQFLERHGIDRGGLFEKLANVADANANYWRHKAEANGIGFIDELVSDAVGGLVPSITSFMLDLESGLTLPYMAGSQEAYKRKQNPVAGGLVEAAKTGILGGIFRMAAPLNTYLRSPLLGTVGGLQEMENAPEGQKLKAFTKGFLTMGAFSALSPGGRLGLNDVMDNAKDLLNKPVSLDRINESNYEPPVDKGTPDIRERLWADDTGALELPTRAERESVYQNVINRFASIENLDERAEALGATIKPGESPKLRARGYLGIGGKVQSVLKDKTFRIDTAGKIQITGEGLKPILDDYERLSPEKDAKIKEQEFNDYFTAVRTVEDLQRPKGDWTEEQIVTPEQVSEAQGKLAELRYKYGPDLTHFEAVAQRLYAFQRRVLHSLVDSGNLSEVQYQNIIGENPHYVPFQRVMDEVEPTFGGSPKAKKPFDEARSPVKKIKGSEREIADVIGSIIKNTYRTLDVAERNTVARTVAKLQKYPELEIEKVDIPIRPIKVKAEEIETITEQFRNKTEDIKREVKTSTGLAPDPNLEASTGPMKRLESVVKDALQARGFTEGEADSALTQIKKAAAKKTTTETPGAPGETQTIETTINKIVKETTSLIESPIDTTIWRASPFKPKGQVIEYFENGKRRYMDVPENLYEAMSGMNETSADMLTKLLSAPTAWLRKGVTLTPDFIIRNFIRDNFDAYVQSTTGFKPFIDSAAALGDVIGRSDLYYDWLRSGAAHSTFVDLSQGNLKNMADEIAKDPSAWKYLNVVGDLEKMSEAVEEATRLGIYKSAIRNGKSDVEAMYAAREGTVDFGVHGQSRGLRTFSSITAFFNPGLQGLDRFIRAQIDNPVGTSLKAVAAITIPSILLWFINKDDPDYKEMPTWRKDLFWNIRVGGPNSFVKFVSIPKPFTIGMVYGSVPERFLNYAYGKDPKALNGLLGSIIDAATPMSGDPASVLLPTAIKPIIENASNWQFFRQRPVVPQARTDMLPESQYGKYTSEAAKLIGEKLGYSPAKIENLVTGYTGGTGQYTLEALDLAIGALTGKRQPKRPTEAADIPVLKAFVGRPAESDPESLRDFYDEAKDIEAAYKSFRDSAKNMNVEDANKFLQEHPKLLLAPTVARVKENLSNIDKAIELISRSTAKDEEKRQAIKGFETIRLRIVQATNKLMEQKPGKQTVADESGKGELNKLKRARKRFSILNPDEQ